MLNSTNILEGKEIILVCIDLVDLFASVSQDVGIHQFAPLIRADSENVLANRGAFQPSMVGYW